MSKNKVHKGFLKRIRVSKTGKVRHRSAFHKHLSSNKSGKRLRQLRKDRYMAGPDAKRLEKMLFRRLRGRNQPRAHAASFALTRPAGRDAGRRRRGSQQLNRSARPRPVLQHPEAFMPDGIQVQH
ncbi:MAG: 50S ribosomal protein L35 [Planctomycetota bacterium]|nr:MAG: 50S ribosomal protein L35 [Planctomycetota bacterium]